MVSQEISLEGYLGIRHTLVFVGVDYTSEIWLDGHLVGRHEGMFQRFDFDVTDFIDGSSDNTLCVKFTGMPEELLPWLEGSDGGYR